jgi:hypothetical protein
MIVVLLAALLLFAAAPEAHSQLSIDNLLELQAGNKPNTEPSDRTDAYEQLNATLSFGELRAGVRFESDHNSEESLPYDQITQRWLEFQDQYLHARVGHYTTILGRGLLHRSFALPAVVLDQPGLGSRYGFLRDVDGVLLEGEWGPVAVRALDGRPNAGDTSPGFAEAFDAPRHVGEMSGGQAFVTVWRGSRVGVDYMRFTPDGTRKGEYGSGTVELDPLRLAGVTRIALPLAVEYARQNPGFAEWFQFDTPDGVPKALYASANLLWGGLGVSAEWKDYERFSLGINDPPSLVREHTFVLPNRSTHLLHAQDEQGYQLEGSYRLARWGSLIANTSRGDGKISPSLPPRRFAEQYVELDLESARDPAGQAAFFYDHSEDTFEGVQGRDIAGGRIKHAIAWSLTGELDVEKAHIRIAPNAFDDWYSSLAIAHDHIGTVAFVWQRTFNPAEQIDTLPRDYFAGTVSAPLGQHHVVTLFAGQRREGLACTAGTCYTVSAFEGAELRLTSRF